MFWPLQGVGYEDTGNSLRCKQDRSLKKTDNLQYYNIKVLDGPY